MKDELIRPVEVSLRPGPVTHLRHLSSESWFPSEECSNRNLCDHGATHDRRSEKHQKGVGFPVKKVDW
ncbi:unannotated protein [freshwater metagenome]|uniref:Unannotated protein n=1 Tax=freshwater metagenome TaxID=449393 RepID=A0A6J6EXG9_9ZZZZ